jgi:type III restriction enzyme
MKLKFDSNLEYQLDAVNSVIDLFEGLPPKQGEFEVSINLSDTMEGYSELGVGNLYQLDTNHILKNLHNIQGQNNVPKSKALINEGDTYEFLNFSVEMETGTGKTYVYLRTIFELNRKFGFKKFIIVVPSVAIREGVLASIDIMKNHLMGLYDNVAFDHFVYSSKDLSKVQSYARSNNIQIMIINIQAFLKDTGDKKSNVIHQEHDRMQGRKPIDYIQEIKPIVIIDEPQSVDNTEKSQNAIKALNPLFCLRYSATHINPYNLLYKLDPIRAYDMRLVKQIEVASVRSEKSFNDAFIRLDMIDYAKGSKTPHAKVTIHENTKSGPKEKKITLRQGTDISEQTNRPGYEGYIVTNICAESGIEHIEFGNGKLLKLHQEEGGMLDEVLKKQIEETVEEHFKKELKLKGKGIKVLSLFFIDRVANYRQYDAEGNPQKGKLALWFDESFQKISKKTLYKDLLPYPVSALHDGYFSADRSKGKIVALRDTSGKTIKDEETYHLIMKDKERLLSPDEPLRFIFSHSALKEGWDNPNVFQLCSLRDMSTERERRQTLGRGLRLPVNSDGERVFDDNINKLTVIASESFEDYARGLQADIEKECGVTFGRVDPIAFSKIVDPVTGKEIEQDTSRQIWKALVKNGYLNSDGYITDKFVPENPEFRLLIPSQFDLMRASITDEIKRYVFKNRVVDARERRRLKYDKRIELNEDFNELWKKINKKTRYSVEFETDELVRLAVKKIEKMERIQPVLIHIEKRELDITEAGVEDRQTLVVKRLEAQSKKFLPDILSFLQRETELTRGTLVEILKKSGRLKEFTINPQAFMTETAKLINRALHEMVVDGIKYEHIEGDCFEMRLFEEEEIEEYLSRLYEVQSNDRSPYDYIPYDSEVEREIAEKLDSIENVKFFCKLPRWFKVPTPLGDYNPDWAVVTENEKKLYLVRETKSTHERHLLRDTEKRKIECGQAHFDAIGVNFKVATNIHEVLEE